MTVFATVGMIGVAHPSVIGRFAHLRKALSVGHQTHAGAYGSSISPCSYANAAAAVREETSILPKMLER